MKFLIALLFSISLAHAEKTVEHYKGTLPTGYTLKYTWIEKVDGKITEVAFEGLIVEALKKDDLCWAPVKKTTSTEVIRVKEPHEWRAILYPYMEATLRYRPDGTLKSLHIEPKDCEVGKWVNHFNANWSQQRVGANGLILDRVLTYP